MTGTGTTYGIGDDESAAALGLPDGVGHAPWPVLALLPHGPELSIGHATWCGTAWPRRDRAGAAAAPTASTAQTAAPMTATRCVPERSAAGAGTAAGRGGAGAGGRRPSNAATTSTTPCPISGSQPAAGRRAVASMRCITWRAVNCGATDRTSAAIAATVGAA